MTSQDPLPAPAAWQVQLVREAALTPLTFGAVILQTLVYNPQILLASKLFPKGLKQQDLGPTMAAPYGAPGFDNHSGKATGD